MYAIAMVSTVLRGHRLHLPAHRRGAVVGALA
jgi:hypothetical protein